jgi:hypothetical protein
MRARWLALVAVLAVTGSGCGDDGAGDDARAGNVRVDIGAMTQPPPAMPASSSPLTPVITVDDARPNIVAALAGTLWAGSGSARYRIDHGDSLGPIEGELVADGAAVRASLRVEGSDGEVTHDIYLEGPAVRTLDEYWEYNHRFPQAGWSWREYNADQYPFLLPVFPLLLGNEPDDGPSYALDTDVRRQVIDAFVASIDLVGEEQLQGVTTTHFGVSLSGPAAMAVLPPDLADELASWSQHEQEQSVDIWLDVAGRVHRFETHIWVFGVFGTATLAIEMWDHDQPLTVVRPADLPQR